MFLPGWSPMVWTAPKKPWFGKGSTWNKLNVYLAEQSSRRWRNSQPVNLRLGATGNELNLNYCWDLLQFLGCSQTHWCPQLGVIPPNQLPVVISFLLLIHAFPFVVKYIQRWWSFVLVAAVRHLPMSISSITAAATSIVSSLIRPQVRCVVHSFTFVLTRAARRDCRRCGPQRTTWCLLCKKCAIEQSWMQRSSERGSHRLAANSIMPHLQLA